VSLEGLVFAEGLVARRVGGTSEPIMALVRQCVSPEPGCCQEALSATVPIAVIGPLVCVGSLDMLLQVFLFDVGFSTAFVTAYVWPLIRM
jgi:hypothetical protein